MNCETLRDLAWKSQSGDEDALEQLLLEAYTPVSYLSGRILQNEQTAAQVTREVLEVIHSKLNSLADPTQFDKWMSRITAARCIQAMPMFHHGSTVSAEDSCLDHLTDGQALTEEESAQAIQQMVDTLPERQRLCILLLCCGGLSVHAIAQLTGFSTNTVAGHISEGQNAIQKQLWALQERDIQFTGLSSLTGILRIAMFHKPEGQDPIPVVYPILGKEIPVPPDPEKWIIRILSVILGILVIAIAVTGAILITKLM